MLSLRLVTPRALCEADLDNGVPVSPDPQGGMAVSPACFGHLTHALLALSAGRLLAVLEGGYCRPALAAAAAHTLAALLGDPPPPLAASLPPPSDRYDSPRLEIDSDGQ